MESPPTADQLLKVWEQARSQTQVQRALSLLALASPAQSTVELARYSIGQRDQELLGLRELIFGSRLTGAATCPVCRQAVEVDFSIADIRAEAVHDPDRLHVLQVDGYEMRFRLPNCDDLAALDATADAPAKKSALLRRCVAEAHVNGALSTVDQLPEPVATALSERMADLDPQGDIQLAVSCPKCGHVWVSPLDIVSYLWSEIHAWAVRTLHDIHALASAYGWREADILALSPWRRQAYLEMIQS